MTITTTDIIIGKRVSALMKARGITQAELGRLIGMDQALVSAKTGGKRGWRADEVFRIASALEIDLSEVMPTPEDTDTAISAIESVPIDAVRAVIQAEELTGLSVRELVALACDSALDSPLKSLLNGDFEAVLAGEIFERAPRDSNPRPSVLECDEFPTVEELLVRWNICIPRDL